MLAVIIRLCAVARQDLLVEGGKACCEYGGLGGVTFHASNNRCIGLLSFQDTSARVMISRAACAGNTAL